MILKKAYKIILSGEQIKIDQDEIGPAMELLNRGQKAIVRQGVINPSYFVCIVEDKERRAKFLDDTKYEPEKRTAGMKPLEDIFEHLSLPNGREKVLGVPKVERLQNKQIKA